jgi:hypothetical protein
MFRRLGIPTVVATAGMTIFLAFLACVVLPLFLFA